MIDVLPAARCKTTRHGLLCNPVAEREMLDFSLNQPQAITEAIRRVSTAISEASGGRKPVYAFYGYTYELAGLQEGIVNFGHLDFERAMDQRFADVWRAPMGYYDRRNGGSGPLHLDHGHRFYWRARESGCGGGGRGQPRGPPFLDQRFEIEVLLAEQDRRRRPERL